MTEENADGNDRLAEPNLGDVEFRWFSADPPILRQYQGKWIGIRGEAVVASGNSLGEVHDELTARGIANALIVIVPTDIQRQSYRIAPLLGSNQGF